MIEYIAQNPATVSAFLSAVAAMAAVFATWQGPRSAAMLAEKIRKDTEQDNERRRMKVQVFATLMQERATIASIESVRMLNSIDFVFSDSPGVREAWADLFAIFHTAEVPHTQLREEKLRVLLKEMGADIGLSNTLKVDDIARIYYPNALAREEEVRMWRQEQALLQIRSQGQQTAPVDQKLLAKFPPKPEAEQ
ncbi:DUF6680 family protein [Mesorhizobium sp.]|uniref:DUF6680 family protein n=1 Tax=Mesorhizobium sp. TaxID=1871066 RepID=UPI000FE5F5D2|nr:DUF6680 family protein [Mesorhizobium sp.]RWM57437.1 MAG: hypothetical protein EOR78_09195 [Mesorhizobium sp.]RWM59083.1 MAG: hypothetical protein EOR79_12235 [Mesorhizobium sp.]RWM93320.1 MAG: hypothetical protein EOR85_27100 [Mesorhizobium sp.]TIO70371.1 MAG: hypothetical protein E5X85_07520 [Mesorhizobium sp.]TIR43150.1 MAG: hypothetical protein E5X64_02535 [Mesorhizobium sp.]